MASNKGLGKGLGALLGDFPEETAEKSPYQQLPIYKVEPNKNQPRQDFDEEELEALAEKKLDAAFICINGKLGNMNVEEAVRLTRILRPKLAIPCHYGMFDSNTEDPAKYTGPLDCALALNHGQEYDFEELMAHV